METLKNINTVILGSVKAPSGYADHIIIGKKSIFFFLNKICQKTVSYSSSIFAFQCPSVNLNIYIPISSRIKILAGMGRFLRILYVYEE